jgi:hypothetical protein
VEFLRHPKLPPGVETFAEGDGIPEFRYCDQSTNSRALNPQGRPDDVLFNAKTGERHDDWEVASLPVDQTKGVRSIKFPYDKAVRVPGKGQTLQRVDYTFDVRHNPHPCMYPHCVIDTKADGKIVNKINPEHVRSLIRNQFAVMADSHAKENPDILKPSVRSGDQIVEPYLPDSSLTVTDAPVDDVLAVAKAPPVHVTPEQKPVSVGCMGKATLLALAIVAVCVLTMHWV